MLKQIGLKIRSQKHHRLLCGKSLRRKVLYSTNNKIVNNNNDEDNNNNEYINIQSPPHIDGSNIFSIQPNDHLNTTTKVKMPEQYWRTLNEDISNEQNNYFENPKILRKKLIWSARKRGWAECGDLLNAFIDSGGMELIEDDDLINFHRLLICDDMFLMCLIAETKECPPELQGNPLKELQQFASTYIVESR